MAMTRTESQLTWSSATSLTISDGGRHDTDAFTFDATDIAAAVQVSADNASTPASGDTLSVYIKWTTGDVVTGGGDDYDTDEHAQFLMFLDTLSSDTPGEDPAVKTVDIPVSAKGFKVSVVALQGATHNIVVKARIATQRAA